MTTYRTDEDDEFDRVMREQGYRIIGRYRMPPKTNVESFDEWEHSHRPNEYWLERKAFLAGWAAGVRYESEKEGND